MWYLGVLLPIVHFERRVQPGAAPAKELVGNQQLATSEDGNGLQPRLAGFVYPALPLDIATNIKSHH